MPHFAVSKTSVISSGRQPVHIFVLS